MIKICFVCLGNICRSPMAEFIMKDLINDKEMSDKFLVESKATSNEEIGNSIYPLAKEKLVENNIKFDVNKKASQLTNEDYDRYDYIIGMEDSNVTSIKKIVNDVDNKVYRLLDFSKDPRDISDPWYTRDFETAYRDIAEGCNSLLEFILKNN